MKLSYFHTALVALLLFSCSETTEEATLNHDFLNSKAYLEYQAADQAFRDHLKAIPSMHSAILSQRDEAVKVDSRPAAEAGETAQAEAALLYSELKSLREKRSTALRALRITYPDADFRKLDQID